MDRIIEMDQLLAKIRSCKECEKYLQFGPRPIITSHPDSKIVIIGQAPGRIVHETGIPWDDKSGDNIRNWMGIDKEVFYDEKKVALIPMGFCYPGKGKTGDLPPRKECAPLWHDKLLNKIPNVKLTLLVGLYAQQYYLKDIKKKNLTLTVQSHLEYLPHFFPLPHPSPRNGIWMRKNPWFEEDVIPYLRKLVLSTLNF